MDNLLAYACIAIAFIYGGIFLVPAGIVNGICFLFFSMQAFQIDLTTGFVPVAAVLLAVYFLTPLILSRMGII